MRANGWAGKSYSAGRYWSLHLWPSVEFSWIVGNRSVHVEAKWLLWEVKVNTFWKPREAVTVKASIPAPCYYCGEDDRDYCGCDGVEF